VTGVANATLEDPLDETPGDHTAVFDADQGHLFADGSDVLSVPYTLDAATGDCPTETPTPTPHWPHHHPSSPPSHHTSLLAPPVAVEGGL
jgi:hypothetical protein